MKLLHITPSYFPAFRFGGPIQSAHLLNKALVKKGITVDVITTNAGLSEVQSAERKDNWIDVDRVRVKYLRFAGYEHYNFSLQIVKEIWNIIDNYDIVHITAVWNFPVLAGALISLIKKKPYIISPRGVFHQEALKSKSNFIKKIYFSLFAKHYLLKSAAIHYTTAVEKNESEKVLKHKNSFIIPNGIDLREIESRNQRTESRITERYILILGRVERIKGFDLLIPAFAAVCKDYKDIKLVIAGNTNVPYTKEVKKMIEEHNLSDKVIFTGEVFGAEKWSFYKNALMFVLPSYSENFGMSVVEAMACGCPVVISDKVGIYKEIEENGAGIIVKTAPASVADGIKTLLNDEVLRKKISANGRAMVEKYYDIDKVAEQMIEQYERIISKK